MSLSAHNKSPYLCNENQHGHLINQYSGKITLQSHATMFAVTTYNG